MTKAEKNQAAALTREQIAERVGTFTEANIRRDKITAKMNKEIDEARQRYAEQLEATEKTMSENREVIEAWAEGNKSLFEKPRSIEFARGLVGFELGGFRVATTKGVTFQAALKLLEKLKWGKNFIRTKSEIDKAALLANKDKLTAAEMAKAGLCIEQEDSFFINPKKDEPQLVEA